MPEERATAPEASVSSRTASGRRGRKWLLGLAAGLVLLVVGGVIALTQLGGSEGEDGGPCAQATEVVPAA